MNLRKDALCAAAELVLAGERLGRRESNLTVTAGQISVTPGASNVIPGAATLTLDIRHQDDSIRSATCDELRRIGEEIARQRRVELVWQIVQETPAVPCSRDLIERLAAVARRHQGKAMELPSGAGHDAAVMAPITPTAMLFVRCKEGISHHPDESVKAEDIETAIRVLCEFVKETR
jgi:allantoate deiminase